MQDMHRTPKLDQLLKRLRWRLIRLIWIHGLGTVATVTAFWLVFAFLADWGLHVPRSVRLLHCAVLIGLPAFFLWRELLRPLARIPDRAGLAVLIENAHPELGEILVSATQLQAAGSGAEQSALDGDPNLIEAVLREAEARARELELAPVLDRRIPLLRMLAGSVCVLFASGLFWRSPDLAGIFFDRMFGGSSPWPRRTYLDVDIPIMGSQASVLRIPEVNPERIEVRVARGSDVPVLITARGLVPDEVALNFESGGVELIPNAGGNSFRQMLASVRRDLSFHVTGGDDIDLYPRVDLFVLQPPDVTGIAVRVEPPPYSGLAEKMYFDADVEVLKGSKLTVHVQTDPADAVGHARLLPEDRLAELEPLAFPLPSSSAPSSSANLSTATEGNAAAVQNGLGFKLQAERSIRFRFELQDDTGLSNPNPGLYAISVIEDRPPELQLVSPTRTDVETVLGGAISLRVRATDDFGLTSVRWQATAAGKDQVLAEGSMEQRPLIQGSSSKGPGLLASVRLEVDSLLISSTVPPPGANVTDGVAADVNASNGADAPVLEEGQLFTLEVFAEDNRQPEALEGRSNTVRVRIVSVDELMRRIQDRLNRVRSSADALAALQREKRARVDDFLAALQGDDLLEPGDTQALQSALSGQRRVHGDAGALTRELAGISETIIYARLDDKAGALLEFLDARVAGIQDRNFHPEPWDELIRAFGEGSLGSAGLARHLLAILEIGMDISEELSLQAEEALERAQNALTMKDVQSALVEAAGLQARTQARIEDLLERLAEWDNFQSVLSLTRDILNRQNALQLRTRRFASEK